MELDGKQQRIIAGWLQRATSSGNDEYGRFIEAWIALNALCYALFAQKASRR